MTETIAVLPSQRSKGQNAFFAKVTKGLRAHGVRVIHNLHGEKPNSVAVWGWKTGKHYRDKGHNVLVFERAYLGDRYYWTSIAWNGLNGHGNFCIDRQYGPERYETNYPGSAKIWQTGGENIIIMGQVRGDASLQGRNLNGFYEEIADKLQKYHRKAVYFRPHPLASRRGAPFSPSGVPVLRGDLKEALANAYLVAAFNSNSIVDAVLSGIPAVCFDQGCMAWEVTAHACEEPPLHVYRGDWLHNLAWKQWTPDEIENGAYWERMRAGYVDGPLIERGNALETVGHSFIKMLGGKSI